MYRVGDIPVRESVMSRFNGVCSTKGRRDPDGATFTVSVESNSSQRGQLMMAD